MAGRFQIHGIIFIYINKRGWRGREIAVSTKL